MILALRSMPVLVAAIVAAGFMLATRSAASFWVSLAVAIPLTVLCLWVLLRRSMAMLERLVTLAFPFFALVTTGGVLLFSEHVLFRSVIVTALVAVLWVFAEQAFHFSYQPSRYQTKALVNLGTLLCVVSIFFGGVVLFDLQLFAAYPLWAAVSTFSAYAVICVAILLALLAVPRSERLSWGGALVFTLTLVFSVLAWLPALPVVKGAVLGVPAAFAITKVRAETSGAPLPNRWTFLVAILVLLLLVATTRWFV